MNKLTSLLILAALSLPAAACSKDSDDATASAEGTAPAAPLAIGKLGLKATAAPAGTQVGDAVVGDGVMIQGPDLVVTLDKASASAPKTLGDAKDSASMYSPRNLHGEELADGWLLTFENTGSLGDNYFVQVHRDIAGTRYACETTSSSATQQKNAVAFCKSLEK